MSEQKTQSRRRSLEAELKPYGWSRSDVKEFAETFGSLSARHAYAPPNTKDYRTSRFSFSTTEARRHLLGAATIAVSPPLKASVVQLDLDDGACATVLIKRLIRARFHLMVEWHPTNGTAHVFFRLQGDGTNSASDVQRVVKRLLVNWSYLDKADKQGLADAARCHGRAVFRLPFEHGRRVWFPYTDEELQIDDPGVARAAWEIFSRLRRHRISTLETESRRKIRRSSGRPAKAAPKKTTHLRKRESVKAVTLALTTESRAKSEKTSRSVLRLPPNNPESATRKCVELQPSSFGRRYELQKDVIGALVRAGYRVNAIERITFDWLYQTGSTDALQRAEWVRRDIKRLAKKFIRDYKPDFQRAS